ncbi:hypothetical protein HON52_01895 [Candidatus Uhrbacteria bacterium]|jgi:hypothetical protein|nr:hypothetical protein [Candidatus Uhrbacteria bacterium]
MTRIIHLGLAFALTIGGFAIPCYEMHESMVKLSDTMDSLQPNGGATIPVMGITPRTNDINPDVLASL